VNIAILNTYHGTAQGLYTPVCSESRACLNYAWMLVKNGYTVDLYDYKCPIKEALFHNARSVVDGLRFIYAEDIKPQKKTYDVVIGYWDSEKFIKQWKTNCRICFSFLPYRKRPDWADLYVVNNERFLLGEEYDNNLPKWYHPIPRIWETTAEEAFERKELSWTTKYKYKGWNKILEMFLLRGYSINFLSSVDNGAENYRDYFLLSGSVNYAALLRRLAASKIAITYTIPGSQLEAMVNGCLPLPWWTPAMGQTGAQTNGWFGDIAHEMDCAFEKESKMIQNENLVDKYLNDKDFYINIWNKFNKIAEKHTFENSFLQWQELTRNI